MAALFRRDKAPVDPAVAAAQAQARFRRRILLGVLAAALVIIGYFVGAAFLPRWWARRIGGWVHDSFTTGLLLGLGFGLLFTLVPLAIAATAFSKRLNRPTRTAVVVLAFVVALPNLLTLGISAGTGSGAHAGGRILDDRAPFFQGATLIGAILAAVIFALATWQYQAGRRVRSAKRSAKAQRRDSAASAPPPPAP